MPYPLLATQGVPYGPLITFRTQGILPPSAVYVGPSDAIQWENFSPAASVPLQLTVRILTPLGEIKELTQKVQTTIGPPFPQVQMFAPNEGFLISANVTSSGGARGLVYTRVSLRKNPLASDVTQGHLLIEGYPDLFTELGYPQSPTESSLNGRGHAGTYFIGSPGNNQNAVHTIQSGTRSLVRAISYVFTADATAGNRTLVVQYLDEVGNVIAALFQPWFVTANQAVEVTWAEGLGFGTSLNQPTNPLPTNLMLGPGSQILAKAFFVGPGDNFSLVTMRLEDWVAP